MTMAVSWLLFCVLANKKLNRFYRRLPFFFTLIRDEPFFREGGQMRRNAVLLLLALMTGCSGSISRIETGANFSSDSVKTIKDGQTTKHDIYSIFGLPDSIQNDNGVVVWLYRYRDTLREKNVLLYGSHFTSASKTLSITFKGKFVEKYSYAESSGD